MTTEESLKSPRLDTLQKGVAAGNTTALNAFWDEVAQQGTPLLIRTYETKQIRASMGLQRSLDSYVRISN